MKKTKSRFYKYMFFGLSFHIFILAGFLLTFKVNVKAAGTNLPYLVSDNVGVYNSWYNSSVDSVVSSVISSVSLSGSNITDTTNYIVFPISYNSSRNRLTCLIFFDPYVDTNFTNDTSYNNFNFTSSNVLVKTPYNKCINFQLSLSDFSTPTKNLDNTTSANLLGNTSSYTLSVGSAKIYYPVLLVGNQDLKDASENYSVISNIIPIVVPSTGHAVSPSGSTPTFGYPIGMHPTAAPTVPSYTVPSLTTAPSIDTTNINSLVQSVFDLLSWGIVSIIQYIGSLISVIIDWFDFVGQLLLWLITYIIDLYNAFVDWMYRLYTSLFEPLYNFLVSFFNFLFNENDQMSIYDLLKEFKESVTNGFSNIWSNSFISGFWSDFETHLLNSFTYFFKIALFFSQLIALGTNPATNEFSFVYLTDVLFIPDFTDVLNVLIANDDFDIITTFKAIFISVPVIINQIESVTPSPTFHIPSLIYHGKQIGDFDIDFSWFTHYKTYSDTIISGILFIGYIYWLFVTFGSHLRGHFILYSPNDPDDDRMIFKG